MSVPVESPESKGSWKDGYSIATMLGLAFLVGLLGGWADILFREFTQIRFGSLTRYPTHFAAVATVGNLLVSLPLTLGLIAASRVLAFFKKPRIALPIILLPLFLAITFNALPRVASYASFILALGLATAAARVTFFFLRPNRVLSAILWGLAVLMLGGVLAFSYVAYGATHRGLPERVPDAESRTNVILITLDTLRAANMSLYGYERPTTPNLEILAKESLVFDRAYSTCSWTLPSHSSIFTGLAAESTKSDWATPLPTEPQVIAEAFRNRGYDTSGFAANLAYCTARSGLARGMRHFEDHRFVFRTFLDCTAFGKFLDGYVHRMIGKDPEPYPGRLNAEEINLNFFAWLDERGNDRPFFTFLNYFDVHQPYITPEPFHSQFDSDELKDDHRQLIQLAEKREASALNDMDHYDGAIAYLDQQLGELMKELKARGLDKNSLIIITSDHGETFGEHKAEGHGTSLYPETIHVPLMFYWPAQIAKGARSSAEVTLRDLPKTILTTLGYEEAANFPGSVMPSMAGAEQAGSAVHAYLSQGIRVSEEFPNFDGDVNCLIESDFQLIIHGDKKLRDELYNLGDDPFARNNLIDEPALQERIEAMRQKLKALVEKAK